MEKSHLGQLPCTKWTTSKLEQVAQGFVHTSPEDLQEWRLLSLSWHFFPVLNHPHTRNQFFLTYSWNFLWCNLNVTSCPSAVHIRENLEVTSVEELLPLSWIVAIPVISEISKQFHNFHPYEFSLLTNIQSYAAKISPNSYSTDSQINE